MLSMPSRDVEHINNMSITSGASCFVHVHHAHTERHNIHPRNPQNLFDDTGDLLDNISLKYCFIIFSFFFLRSF